MKNKALVRIGVALLPTVLLIALWPAFRSSPQPQFKGKPVSYWMMETRSQDLEQNEGLSAIGTNALPYLVKALRTRETWFGKLLGKIGPRLPSSLNRHLPRVPTKDEVYRIRFQAIASLRAFGFEATPALPALYEAFQDENPAIQANALYAVYLIGPTKESIPHLIATWNNTKSLHKANRSDVIANLGKIGHLDPKAVVPVLIQSLGDDASSVRANAPFYLGKIGHPASTAVPKLIALLEDKAGRAGAAYALGRVTNFVEAAITPLRWLVQYSNPQARACAALTLWRFTGESAPALQTLSEVLSTSKAERQFIAKCLGEMGPAAKEAIPLLTKIAQTKETYDMVSYHRLCSAEAILKIDPSAANAIDVIVDALKDSNPWLRRQAAMSLGTLGSIAGPAIPALEQASQEKDREVRHHSAEAFKNIRRAWLRD